jgi:hypothetical protein
MCIVENCFIVFLFSRTYTTIFREENK